MYFSVSILFLRTFTYSVNLKVVLLATCSTWKVSFNYFCIKIVRNNNILSADSKIIYVYQCSLTNMLFLSVYIICMHVQYIHYVYHIWIHVPNRTSLSRMNITVCLYTLPWCFWYFLLEYNCFTILSQLLL